VIAAAAVDAGWSAEQAGGMDLITLHRRTVEEFVRRVEAVADDQWKAPTPDSEWDVRTLVNHVVGEERWTAPLLRGMTMAEVGSALDGDLLGDDPRLAAREAAAEATAAVDEHMPGGGIVHLSYGEEDMAEYVRQLSADHLIHGWDLAAATGGDTTMDPELVAEIADWFAGREEMYRAGGAVGPRVEGAAGDPHAQLLAGFGRDAGWRPPG
jgi:uncharacterized protein (TIGR03086 family)